MLRRDPDLFLVLDAVSGAASDHSSTLAGVAAGQFVILFRPSIMAVLLTSAPGADAAARLADAALPLAGRRVGGGAESTGQ